MKNNLLATENFAVVEQVQSQHSIKLWNVDAFVKKASGHGFKRAPHLNFDRGVSRGVVALFKFCPTPPSASRNDRRVASARRLRRSRGTG